MGLTRQQERWPEYVKMYIWKYNFIYFCENGWIIHLPKKHNKMKSYNNLSFMKNYHEVPCWPTFTVPLKFWINSDRLCKFHLKSMIAIRMSTNVRGPNVYPGHKTQKGLFSPIHHIAEADKACTNRMYIANACNSYSAIHFDHSI